MLASGSRIGPYEIAGLLGRGGMGEVYRARDPKLDRDVAIKILPAAFARDGDRLARFEREARLLASLNHPNIGAIYGFEETSGPSQSPVRALVLELVEGETLAERLAQRGSGLGGLPIAEAIDVARQTADALHAAHERGIVHRDLKPANIKITPDGLVKVLDFGLAKDLKEHSTAAAEDAETQALLKTGGVTEEGQILGTVAYMSPEQTRGRVVDKRADIWAFGCVLYELLAGRSAFARETASDTIASIIGNEPEWTALPAETPESLRRLLARCLQKDARRRLHDIADAGIELEDAMAAPAASMTSPRPRLPRRVASRSMLWLAIAAGLVLVAAALFRFQTSADLPSGDSHVTRLTDLPGLEESPAISPDGRSVAFTAGVGARRQLFVQLVAGGAPLPLTTDPVDHQSPRWSPDSSSIVYFSPAPSGDVEGSLWSVPALGGQPRRVISSLGGADLSSTDGSLAFFRLTQGGVHLVTAAADGSDPRVVAQFAPTTYYLYPRWSPDGKSIAFQRGDSIRFDLFVVSAAGGEPRQLTRDNSMISGFAWLPDSTGIVYSSSRGGTMPYLPTMNLWLIAVDESSPRRLTSSETSYVHPDVTKSGVVVVSRMRLQSDIWRFPVDGLPDENVRRGTRVTRQTGQVLTPTAGPGDTEVAFLSDRGGHANLWVLNTASGEQRQITYERDSNVALGVPIWSPTSRTIAFVSSRGNQGLTFGVWLVDADGSNLRNLANPGLGPAWSSDGRWVYYSTRGSGASDVVLQKVPVDGGPAATVTTERLRNVIGSDGRTLYYTFERPLVDGTPEFEIRAATPESAPFRVLARIAASRVPIWQIVNPTLSPDGQWLAQALTDGLTTNIWALSTATGQWRQLTDFGDRATFMARRVSWSSDGRSIFTALGDGDADIVLLEGLTTGGPD